MVLDAGDEVHRYGDHVILPSDGNVTEGDAVTIDAVNDQVVRTTSASDVILGVCDSAAGVADDPSGSDFITVHVGAPVVMAKAEGTVAFGDLLEGSATAGALSASTDSLVTAVNEGGTATYSVHSRPIVALEDAADGESFKAVLL